MTAREETVLPPTDPSITDENDWWEFTLTDVKVLRPGKMLYANLLEATDQNPVQVIGCLELKKEQEHLRKSPMTASYGASRVSLADRSFPSSAHARLPPETNYHRRCHPLRVWTDRGSLCRALGGRQVRLVPHLARQGLSINLQSHGPGSRHVLLPYGQTHAGQEADQPLFQDSLRAGELVARF